MNPVFSNEKDFTLGKDTTAKYKLRKMIIFREMNALQKVNLKIKIELHDHYTKKLKGILLFST